MNATVGFPTLGELIQFTYDTFGVLPRKRGLEDDIDEKEKKTIQKALSRLAKEEGDINENFGELINKLAYLVGGYITNQRVNMAIFNSLMEVLDVYLAVLKSDGTYLDKKGTVKWLIVDFIIGRLVFSIKANTLKYNVVAENFSTPGEFWFLPTIENEKVIFPLEKVMLWVYEKCGCSQKKFHNPAGANPTNYVQQEQNLENAKNWIKCKSLPSLPELLWNFNYSIDRINETKSANTYLGIDRHLRENFCLLLSIARISTFVFRELLRNYELSFAKEICAQFQCQLNDVSEDFLKLENCIKNILECKPYSQDFIDEVWFNETSNFCYFYAQDQVDLNKLLKDMSHEEMRKLFQNQKEVNNLIRNFGKFLVQSIAGKLNRPSTNQTPINFSYFLFEGLNLKDNKNASLEEITMFQDALKKNKLEPLLPWMLTWIKGAYHYRRQEYQLAFPFFKEAFNSAKYCAGNKQYKLVNQFVEVAAKNNKRMEFNKGIRWAQYLGIEIRWLRQEKPTVKKLDFVFAIMKKANYHLL